MARIGSFDPEIRGLAWFDEGAVAEGVFDQDLIDAAAAGGGNSIAVPAGSLVISGFAPTVTAPAAIAVPAGSLALNGFAPTVSNPNTVTVPAGSLVLAGFAPVVTNVAGNAISVPAGTITLSAFAPVVTNTTAAPGSIRYDIITGRLVKTINSAVVISF